MLAMAFVCNGSASGQIPCEYQVQLVPNPPPCGPGIPNISSAKAISPNGRYIAGGHGQCDLYGEAFVWDRQTGQYVTLPRPPGVYDSGASDVNDAGLVVGSYWRSSGGGNGGGQRGYIYNIHTGQYVAELGPVMPSSNGWCSINAINSSGTVCGTRSIGRSVNPRSAFIWSQVDGFTDLGLINGFSTSGSDLNDSDEVCVNVAVAVPGYSGYVWADGVFTDLGFVPGGLSSTSQKINNLGQATVSGILQESPQFISHAFIYDHGLWTHLPPLPGDLISGPSDIARNGLAVGASKDDLTTQVWCGIIWFAGRPYDLNEMLPRTSDLYLEIARRISDEEQIVCLARNSSGQQLSLILTPIAPVPGDTDCDGLATIYDLLNVINEWGPCAGCRTDLNGDGVVNVWDLLLVLQNWHH